VNQLRINETLLVFDEFNVFVFFDIKCGRQERMEDQELVYSD
jgi:hypothetical protein